MNIIICLSVRTQKIPQIIIILTAWWCVESKAIIIDAIKTITVRYSQKRQMAIYLLILSDTYIRAFPSILVLYMIRIVFGSVGIDSVFLGLCGTGIVMFLSTIVFEYFTLTWMLIIRKNNLKKISKQDVLMASFSCLLILIFVLPLERFDQRYYFCRYVCHIVYDFYTLYTYLLTLIVLFYKYICVMNRFNVETALRIFHSFIWHLILCVVWICVIADHNEPIWYLQPIWYLHFWFWFCIMLNLSCLHQIQEFNNNDTLRGWKHLFRSLKNRKPIMHTTP